MKNQRIDVGVIGGGAAGLMASAVAAERGLSVALFEPNAYTGKKLGITGKGRCNVTNNSSVRAVMDNIPTNGRFLYSALSGFTPQDTMELFERLGVRLKTERGNRVFPESDKASDIVGALRGYARKAGVTVIKERVTDIEKRDNAVSAVITDNGKCECSSAILCTGGLSYPLTGSTGDGYVMAKKSGHDIIMPKPSLVPLVAEQDFCAEMQGLSLRNVTLTAFNKAGKRIFEELGEMLFTHFGLSGPLAIAASAHMRDFVNDSYHVLIDLKPGLDEEKLDARILRDFKKYSNRDFANSLDELLNKKMIPVIVALSGIPGDTKVHSITHKQRRTLLQLIKGLRIDIRGLRPIGEAIITSGGVCLRQINPKTMESKLISGLFFAGEIIDADAYTGGYNLQIAWSTAYAAGNSVF
ncbi:MAG: NAD(P)/FAD-dependent oxidoreductase [Oscillospiraceae bacterium]